VLPFILCSYEKNTIASPYLSLLGIGANPDGADMSQNG